MNSVLIPIPNVDNTVMRESVHNAAVQIANMLSIKPSLVKVNDDNESMIEETDEDHAAKTREEKVRIYTEQSSSTVLYSSGYGFKELTDPFIKDDELNLRFTSLYSSVELESRFKYESKNKTDLEVLKTNLINLHNASRDANEISLKYRYVIPKPAISLLSEINRLRQYADTVDEDLYTYIVNNCSTNVVVSSDIKNRKAYLYIAEIQDNVIMMITTTPSDYIIEYDKEERRYTLEFRFKFTINVPRVINLTYPSSVYGGLLNSRFIVSQKATSKSKAKAQGYLSSTRDRIFDFAPDILYPTIPATDRSILKPSSNIFSFLFTVLCDVSSGDRLLFNLDTDLTSLSLKDDVIDFLKNGEYQYVTKPLRSVFYIQLFNGSNVIRYDKLEVDQDLNIMSTEDLDVKGEYRVAISIVIDTDYMQVKDIERANKAGMVNLIREYLNITDYNSDKDRYKNTGHIKYKRDYNAIVEFQSYVKAALLTNKNVKG